MNAPAWHKLVAAATLVVGLIGGFASPASGATGEVRAQLTLYGDVSADEAHQIYFDTADSGQTRVAICGRFAPACQAQTYELRFTGLTVGDSFAYGFERVTTDGRVTRYFEARGVVGEVTDILASFRYGVIPDTALTRTLTRSGQSLVIGVVLASLVGLAFTRRSRTSSH